MEKPEVILSDEQPCGRILSFGQDKLLSISGICPAKGNDPSAQADQMLAKTESVLNQCGADMFSVARTWMWLRDILSWYDDFNKVRNSFFVERGLIGNGDAKMPASTGIGIGSVNGSICTMDLISVFGPKSSIEYLDTTGMQNSAFDYGSAFSRASKIQTPACKTVFVSGTASIDLDGATIHVGDTVAQIQTAFDNIETVLNEMGCVPGDIAHAILYCKTAEIEQVIHSQWSNLDWPFFTAITDVCRDDLLFEIEVTAISA